MRALELVKTWPVPTAAVAVLNRDGVVATTGPVELVLPWASVTKLLTALTALCAVRDGRLELDEPAGPPGSTVRHLLAHASGLSPEDDTVVAAPGRRRIYSNSGFEQLADHLSARTGEEFDELLHRDVGSPGTELEFAL